MWEVQALKKYIVLSLLVSMICACTVGCKIDVNKLASQHGVNNVSDTNSDVSSIISDNDDTESTEEYTASETYYDTDSSQTDASFDTSAYAVFYVSGAASVPIYENENGTKQSAILKSGDRTYLISSSVTGYTFVYSEALDGFGYVDSYFLTPDYSEVTKGETYYVTDDNTPAYSDKYCSSELFELNRNDAVSVMAKVSNGFWLICDKNGTYGYVSMYSLSEEKVKKKTESKHESKAESKPEDTAPSDDRIIGFGDFPETEYSVYNAAAETGYLALRSEKSSDASNIIGELYYGDEIYVIDTSDVYWYVYAPSLGMYGYSDSRYIDVL